MRAVPVLAQQPELQCASLVHEDVQYAPKGGNVAQTSPSQQGAKLGPQRLSAPRHIPPDSGRQIPSVRLHAYDSGQSRPLVQASVQNDASSTRTQKRPGSQSAWVAQ